MSAPTYSQPPQAPPGYNPQWSPDHQAWYYVNIQTGQSTWEMPTHPAYLAYPSYQGDPNAPQPHLAASPHQPYGMYPQPSPGQNEAQSQPHLPGPPPGSSGPDPAQLHPLGPPPTDNAGKDTPQPYPSGISPHLTGETPTPQVPEPQPGATHPADGPSEEHSADGEPAEGERGLMNMLGGRRPNPYQQQHQGSSNGKLALGAGVGVLLGGVMAHEWDKHGHFNVSAPGVFANINNNQPQGRISGWGSGITGIFGRPNNQASQQQYHHQQQQQQQQQQHHQNHHHQGGGLFGGLGSSLGMGGGRQLHILSANYGGGDVTDKVRSQVKPDGVLDLHDDGDGSVYDSRFGDHWGGNPKSLVILYQYAGGPMELLVAWQACGIKGIFPNDHPRPIRRALITECGPVIAVVWGIMQNCNGPVPQKCIRQIANGEIFTANNNFFEFNGWEGISKTAVVFARDGQRIYNTAVRQDNGGRLF